MINSCRKKTALYLHSYKNTAMLYNTNNQYFNINLEWTNYLLHIQKREARVECLAESEYNKKSHSLNINNENKFYSYIFNKSTKKTFNSNKSRLYTTLFENLETCKQKLFIKSLVTTVPKWIQYCIFNKNEITVYIYPEFIIPFFFYIKNHANTRFEMLIDVTAVDYPSRVSRFEVVYNLLSISYNARIKVKSCLHEVFVCQSITCLYSSATWWEREVWDMFGIFFCNHPDLRRILTDYGFQGHPLRKDFPLSGFVEVRYDDSEKRVITEPIEVTQEFRYFDFASPWEQIEKV